MVFESFDERFRSLQRKIASAGHRVVRARSAEEFRAYAPWEQYCLIVIALTDFDPISPAGIELTRSVREQNERVPIIVTSASEPTRHEVAQCFRAGASDYIDTTDFITDTRGILRRHVQPTNARAAHSKHQITIDSVVKEAAIVLLHDLRGAIVQIEIAATNISRKLPRVEVGDMHRLLNAIHAEYEKIQSAAKSGFLGLVTGAYRHLRSENVVRHLLDWATRQSPSVAVTLPRNLREFVVAHANPILLTNVLANLHKNSLAAKRRGGKTPSVSVECVVRHGTTSREFLDVYFRDDGRGIRAKRSNWPKLFILKPKRKRSGWGMGLPMSRHMMQLMDGELEVHSSMPNEGTTMRLEFRRAET